MSSIRHANFCQTPTGHPGDCWEEDKRRLARLRPDWVTIGQPARGHLVNIYDITLTCDHKILIMAHNRAQAVALAQAETSTHDAHVKNVAEVDTTKPGVLAWYSGSRDVIETIESLESTVTVYEPDFETGICDNCGDAEEAHVSDEETPALSWCGNNDEDDRTDLKVLRESVQRGCHCRMK